MRRVYESEPGRMETLDTAADELFLFSLEGESARTRRHQKIYAPRVCWRPERARPPSASATIHLSRRKGHCTLPFLTVSDERRPLFWNLWSWLNKPAIRYKTANRNAAMAGNDHCNLDKQAYIVTLSQVCIFLSVYWPSVLINITNSFAIGGEEMRMLYIPPTLSVKGSRNVCQPKNPHSTHTHEYNSKNVFEPEFFFSVLPSVLLLFAFTVRVDGVIARRRCLILMCILAWGHRPIRQHRAWWIAKVFDGLCLTVRCAKLCTLWEPLNCYYSSVIKSEGF